MTGKRLGRVGMLVLGGIILIVPLLFPLYWILVASLQDLSTIYAHAPSLLPHHVIGQNYRHAWTIMSNIGVSFVISISVVVLSWLIGVPAAYALARVGGRLGDLVVLIMLITQMVPGISLSIALYKVFHSWHLLGSYVGLILADASGAVPFVILVVRAFMAGLPGELFDSAAVEGAGPIRAFLQIALPLAVPAIMTVALFTFLGAWGDFINALTLNGGSGPQPLTMGLYKFIQQHSTDLGAIFAAAVIAAIPTTILLYAGQRWIRGGLRAGALKG
jgi:multiple sugar transport system permease protein